jgi:hypothetical protein
MGSEFDPAEVEQIRKRITIAQPDFLFVCLGVPRQEQWIEEFALDLPVKLVMGDGAAFDVMAGFFHRLRSSRGDSGVATFLATCSSCRRYSCRQPTRDFILCLGRGVSVLKRKVHSGSFEGNYPGELL